MMPWELLEGSARYIDGWLGGYGGALGSVAGVLIVDYWMLRKTELDLRSLYSSRRRVSLHERLEPRRGDRDARRHGVRASRRVHPRARADVSVVVVCRIFRRGRAVLAADAHIDAGADCPRPRATVVR